MKKCFWGIIFSFFLILECFSTSSDTICLKKDRKQHIIAGQELYFFSPTDLPIQTVISKEFKQKDDLHLLYITGNVWVKFIIKNSTDKEHFVFNASDGHISGLYMYKPMNGDYQMTPPKQFHSEDGREIRNRLPSFYIDLKKGETQTFYVKITPENEVVNFSYIIQDYTNYVQSAQIDYFVVGLYFGTLLIIICVNFFYYYSLKDRIFLIYAMYVLGNLLLSVTLDGLTWLLIPNSNIAYHANFFCIRFWNDSMLFFIMQLVNIKKHNKILNRIGYSYLFYHTVLMALFELTNLGNNRAYFMAQWEGANWIVSIILAFIIIVKSKNENQYLYRYYLVLFIILVSAFLFYVVLHLDKGAHYLIFEHGMKAATLLEILTLSFAVSRRFKITEQDLKRKQEEEKQLTEQVKQLEMDIRKAQMNPHFMFNALTSIDYFIMKHNSQLARNYLEKFANLMRLTLDNSRNDYIYIEDDLKALKYYVELEFLRLKDQAHTFELDIDNQIKEEEIAVPALLIQPFVENAIWHGLQKKQIPGRLSVKLQFIENALMCIIEDNGGGMMGGKPIVKRKSSGIEITKERLHLIHVLLKTNYQFEIENVYEEGQVTGTRVQFSMPYIRE